ncbi:MAG TPA: DUF349 domain-containing protein [Mycobacteriales bacterium]|nr:DUF349 domain-containing protein [Mycobacteriales bacterium]
MENRWGRIDASGTVYVTSPDGERAVGSWQAGPPAEGLAHFERRFAELEAQAALLSQRLESGVADPAALRTTARRLRDSLPTANAVGDFAGLHGRLEEFIARADEQVATAAATRAARKAEAVEALGRLAAEAETLAASSQWKASGDRLRALGEEWKAAAHGVDRKVATQLWQRFAAARAEFTRRRGQHFAALAVERHATEERKTALVVEAEGLAESSDWTGAARRFRELVTAWKDAGRAAKATEDALWNRFRAAQQTFFGRRATALAERDAVRRGQHNAREELVAAAEALEPNTDLAGAKRQLREIQERWAAAGPVPREEQAAWDRRFAAVEDRVRSASEERWDRPNPQTSPLVERLRESVAKLERRAERARAAGRDDEAAEAEAKLSTQREWLARAVR